MAAPLDLGLLNRNSAKFARFHMKMTKGNISSYTYQDKKKGTTVKVHQYLVTVVGTDPSSYCIAFSKGTEAHVQQAAAKFKDRIVDLV